MPEWWWTWVEKFKFSKRKEQKTFSKIWFANQKHNGTISLIQLFANFYHNNIYRVCGLPISQSAIRFTRMTCAHSLYVNHHHHHHHHQRRVERKKLWENKIDKWLMNMTSITFTAHQTIWHLTEIIGLASIQKYHQKNLITLFVWLVLKLSFMNRIWLETTHN